MSPLPMHSKLLSTFSSARFSVFSFMLRSLVHLKLSFVQADKFGYIYILLHVVRVFPFVEVFSFNGFRFFVKNLVSVGMWVYFWAFRYKVINKQIN